MKPATLNIALLVPLTFALLALSGCGSVLTQSTSDAAGVAGAGIASAVTTNGSVTAAIGLGVQSVAASGLGYVERDVHHKEQQKIADAAGPLAPGAVAPWSVTHVIPIEDDQHGEVSVSQQFGGTLFPCKEVVFSVDHVRTVHGVKTDRPDYYVTTICRERGIWRWAQAEPATARWGTLQ
ncbi:MAG: hypothetical protein PHI71_13760 [Acidiphilium sp.]|nr:hypothetical protein [Acidiphilium sp.]